MNYKEKKENKDIHGSFWLLLFQDLIRCGEVFYVKLHNSTNRFLWNKCLRDYDSRPCSIGSIFCLLGPKPITKLYCNSIIMLTPSSDAILMNEPSSTSISDHFGNVIDVNKTISFHIIFLLKLRNLSITSSISFFMVGKISKRIWKTEGAVPVIVQVTLGMQSLP